MSMFEKQRIYNTVKACHFVGVLIIVDTFGTGDPSFFLSSLIVEPQVGQNYQFVFVSHQVYLPD